jgi:hypothetical protein
MAKNTLIKKIDSAINSAHSGEVILLVGPAINQIIEGKLPFLGTKDAHHSARKKSEREFEAILAIHEGASFYNGRYDNNRREVMVNYPVAIISSQNVYGLEAFPEIKEMAPVSGDFPHIISFHAKNMTGVYVGVDNIDNFFREIDTSKDMPLCRFLIGYSKKYRSVGQGD